MWLPIGTVWIAASHGTGILTNRGAGWLLVGGRLKPGVTVEQAAAELDAIGKGLEAEYPGQNRGTGLYLMNSSPVPGNSGTIGGFLALLFGLVTLVLAIACANLTGVLLARAVARRREIAVRLAIGAGRARLIRQLLAETFLLFALGGLMGLLLARGMTSLLVSLLPALPFPVDVTLALDTRAILFTSGLALITALLSGLAPALQASRTQVVSGLKAEGEVPGRLRLRHVFLVGQVALSILLVVIAGLFARALQRMGSTDPGFDPHGVDIATLDLSVANYNETTGPLFAHELIEHVRAIPGVQSATIAAVLPSGFERIGMGGLGMPGATSATGERFSSADWNIVEPGYFTTLRMPLLAGRDFNDGDRKGSQLVAIVGEGVARRFWPGQDPVGKLIVQAEPKTQKSLLVVGVARDPKYGSLVDGNSNLYVYLPLQQVYLPGWTMVVARTEHRQQILDSIRSIVGSMDPNLPMVTTQTAEDYTALGLLPQRIAVSVAGSLGLVGLLLAAIGIYGVTAYVVACRTREIGIRIALGARQGSVIRMVLREGMSLAIIGSAIGLALAAGFAQLLTSVLFGVKPIDPVTFTCAALLFVSISLVACYLPARRAGRITALEALRTE
jgi:predicted permease